jgi:hypothetical protein
MKINQNIKSKLSKPILPLHKNGMRQHPHQPIPVRVTSLKENLTKNFKLIKKKVIVLFAPN